MLSSRILKSTVALALLAPAHLAIAASPVFKCVIDGSVTFQNTPCPVDKPSRNPTKDELNAERKKRLAEAAAQAASAPARSAPVKTPPAAGLEPAARAPAPPRDPGFRCDGRQHCTQMRSCAEARYFLAHCPGTKMDGDGDGIPCEQQWCAHPLAK